MSAQKRRKSREVRIGNVTIGGDNPIAVQSMLKSRPSDVALAANEAKRLEAMGCSIVRVAVPNNEAIKHLEKLCSVSVLPIVADIHYDYRLAIAAAECGVAKVRLNPGNLKNHDQIREVVEICKAKNIAIRVGANSGSIKRRNGTDDRSMVDALVSGVLEYCEFLESLDFSDIVISVKASDVHTNTVVYRQVASRCDYPLHLGLTATGPRDEGIIKSSIALGSLLVDGIGDTIRVSLTSTPFEEVEVAQNILRATGYLFDRPVIVACPTCGRCEVDTFPVLKQVQDALADSKAKIRVAVMGCVVNGPGEAAECDVGVACGKGSAVLFEAGQPVQTVSVDRIVPELLKLIEKLDNQASGTK